MNSRPPAKNIVRPFSTHPSPRSCCSHMLDQRRGATDSMAWAAGEQLRVSGKWLRAGRRSSFFFHQFRVSSIVLRRRMSEPSCLRAKVQRENDPSAGGRKEGRAAKRSESPVPLLRKSCKRHRVAEQNRQPATHKTTTQNKQTQTHTPRPPCNRTPLPKGGARGSNWSERTTSVVTKSA